MYTKAISKYCYGRMLLYFSEADPGLVWFDMLRGFFDAFCESLRVGVMGRPLEHGRPPESCFLGTGRSPDTSAPEKVHGAGFHESTDEAELKELLNKTSAALSDARLSSLCN